MMQLVIYGKLQPSGPADEPRARRQACLRNARRLHPRDTTDAKHQSCVKSHKVAPGKVSQSRAGLRGKSAEPEAPSASE